MAVPAGTYQAFQQIGRKEDVSNDIFNIDPTETPFVSGIRKATATNTKHEWQSDAYEAATANAHIQGDDTVARTAVPTVRLFNYSQILKYGVNVSRTSRKSETYGRRDELIYQLDKRMAEIKRDLEKAAVQNQAGTAGAAASAALMASAESWIATNETSVSSGTDGTTPGQSGGIPGTAPTDSSTVGTITQAITESMIQQAWDAGGNPKVIMVAAAGKVKIAGFTGIATRFKDVPKNQEAVLVTGVDIYESNFGQLMVVPNRFMRTRVALILDMKMWALTTFDPFSMEKLAKTGDADKYQIVGEYTLESRNEKASAKIADINFAV